MHRREFCQRSGLALLAMTAAAHSAPTLQDTTTEGTPMKIRPINPTGYAYAQAAEVTGFSRLLFVSGQVPADANDVVPADFRDQYRLAWRNVEAQLTAAGMSFDNLVKVNIYLASRDLIPKSAGLRQEILGGRSPALTIVIAGIFDESWLLEIEAIAAG